MDVFINNRILVNHWCKYWKYCE